jgi:transposase
MKHESASLYHDWREARRFRAWELSQQGKLQQVIAADLGVTPGAVSQWINTARMEGVEALRSRKAKGPTPRLSDEQRAQLPNLLAQGAPAHGFTGDVWTAARVATVIERTFGVRYHPTHVSRLLATARWTVQQPVPQATQRDEAAIQAWRAERWPALKKKPAGNTGPSYA